MTLTRRLFFCGIVLAVLSLPFFSPAQAQGITITVIPALAPNVYGSPNWNAWVSNATTAIANGYASYGDPSSPSYYQRAPAVISVTNDIVTGFPSWDGHADPGNVFGANRAPGFAAASSHVYGSRSGHVYSYTPKGNTGAWSHLGRQSSSPLAGREANNFSRQATARDTGEARYRSFRNNSGVSNVSSHTSNSSGSSRSSGSTGSSGRSFGGSGGGRSSGGGGMGGWGGRR